MATVRSAESVFLCRIAVGVVLLAAAGVFILNLVYIIPEIRHVRIAPPQRVEEEEQQLAAAQASVQPQPASPWD